MTSPNGKTLLTETIVSEVKKFLKDYKPLPAKSSERKGMLSLRDIAGIVGIGYSSVRMIWKGKHDKAVPVKEGLFDMSEHQDWIVGGKIENHDRWRK